MGRRLAELNLFLHTDTYIQQLKLYNIFYVALSMPLVITLHKPVDCAHNFVCAGSI